MTRDESVVGSSTFHSARGCRSVSNFVELLAEILFSGGPSGIKTSVWLRAFSYWSKSYDFM